MIRTTFLCRLAVAFVSLSALVAYAAQDDIPADAPPLSPEQSLATMHLTEGYRVELVAAEPLVRDPVDIAWGPDGRLWVVEMLDYPLGIDDSGQVGKDSESTPGGRIRYLQDTNNDGTYDTATTFLDGEKFPTSIAVWRQGVIVTAGSEIFYAEDTTGDGKADQRRTLFTGFAQDNTQLRVNGLEYGLDNWLYLANGLTTRGEIRSEITGETLTLGARDLRINPDTGEMQPLSGESQFGRVSDDHGNWFGVHNSYPVWHYVLEDFHLRRNPHIALGDPKNHFDLPRNLPVYPRSQFMHDYDHPHRGSLLTSACGLTLYRDSLLFPRDQLHVLTCEPQHNLVHRQVLRRNGPTFTAHRHADETHSEFLAAEDLWFRPVKARTGPDGALWIVDMYRYLIEHPQWMPPEAQQRYRPHYRTGHDRGRIYRVVPDNAEARPITRLDQLDPHQLVAALDSPNGTQRQRAQQLLIWNADDAATPPLKKMAAEHTNPLARLHALCTLDGLGELTSTLIAHALQDDHHAVRRHAVRLAAAHPDDRACTQRVAQLADDPDATVRLQAALTLGQWDHASAGEALGHMAVTDADNHWLRAAVMTGALTHHAALVDAVINAADSTLSPLTTDLLTMALAQNDRDAIARLLEPVVNPRDDGPGADQLRVLAQWQDSLARRGSSIEQLRTAADDALAQRLKQIPPLLKTARGIAADTESEESFRLAAIDVLGRRPGHHADDYETLIALINTRTSTHLQTTALAALRRIGHDQTPPLLLNKWASLLPAVRPAALDTLLTRADWTLALLEEVDAGRVAASHIDTARQQQLTNHNDQRVREHARTLFASSEATDRAQVLATYQAALELEGDPENGREVFAQACATCHRVDDLGHEIGPNVLSLTDRSPQGLLAAILDPNQNIDPRYATYSLTLADGQVLMGILAGETSNSITLLTLDAQAHTILRRDVAQLTSLDLSLMPEGLEAAINLQDMADLIRFLRQPQ